MSAGFSWIVPRRVAGMARPYPEDAPWLKEQGVTAILSLTERPVEMPGFEAAHLPVRDMTSPTLDQLHQAVLFMRAVVARGGAVVAHCGAGMGRTGTVLAAYLVAEGKAAAEAIVIVRTLRPGSIETEDQEEMLYRYEELVRGSSA